MKRTLLAAASAFSLTLAPAIAPAPALAQADKPAAEELSEEELIALGEMFGDIFGTADPLTPEQELRVPVAMQVVARIMPDGTMARMMNESMAPMMDAMMMDVTGTPALALSSLTGLNPVDIASLDEKRVEEALALLDPDAAERNRSMNTVFMELLSDLMVEMEPAYRAGLARAYAVRFTKEELLDINAYFSTPTGAKYAGESYLIFADPQVMATMNEMMPSVMQRMPALFETIEELSENFSAGRSFSELSEGEQARLAELLGVSEEELAASDPTPDDVALEETYQET